MDDCDDDDDVGGGGGDEDDDGGTAIDSLPPAATCITQPGQPLPTIHYGMNGRPLFAQHVPSNFTRSSSVTALPLDGTSVGKPRPTSLGTSPMPSLPGAVFENIDDEQMRAVMNAIRPMEPAYCVPGSKEVDGEMTNVIRNSVVTWDNAESNTNEYTA